VTAVENVGYCTWKGWLENSLSPLGGVGAGRKQVLEAMTPAEAMGKCVREYGSVTGRGG
jgi:hypothetical protein